MANEYDELANEVFRKIGVNIILFQKIEKGLKFLLPYICKLNSTREISDIRKIQKEVKSKTLGTLISDFLNSVDYDSDYFSEYLKKIVDERNKLVHHFGGSEGLNILNTEEGCRECLDRLELQRKEVYSFYEDIHLYVLSLIWLMREQYGESNPNINLLYEELRTTITNKVEYINLIDPIDTVWENTEIIKLLHLAELHTQKIENMTLLSEAGKFIKNQNPECTPKNYGIKNLTTILKVSGLFEVVVNQEGCILYKSKMPH